MSHTQRMRVFRAWISYANSTTNHAKQCNWTRFVNACRAAGIAPWRANSVDAAFFALYLKLDTMRQQATPTDPIQQ